MLEASRVGVVTEKYPYVAAPAPEGFRGAPRIDTDKCIGCGACSRACPSGALQVFDEEEYRVVRIFYGRCIYCYRCMDVCPQGAIIATREYELTADNTDNLYFEVKLRLAKCVVCGRSFETERKIRRVIELARERGVTLNERMLRTCPECRRARLAPKPPKR